ncbi:hypothetical protein L6452_28174 [Arctium lappa]|uniref:Uncharacterized protein n=1 Tax=Arctium lappa TaxID=4217 RepID=A0ACB8ZY87_ARCLA|nr:hypothetical protein L6452_28174 [Arctium lappa]
MIMDSIFIFISIGATLLTVPSVSSKYDVIGTWENVTTFFPLSFVPWLLLDLSADPSACSLGFSFGVADLGFSGLIPKSNAEGSTSKSWFLTGFPRSCGGVCEILLHSPLTNGLLTLYLSFIGSKPNPPFSSSVVSLLRRCPIFQTVSAGFVASTLSLSLMVASTLQLLILLQSGLGLQTKQGIFGTGASTPLSISVRNSYHLSLVEFWGMYVSSNLANLGLLRIESCDSVVLCFLFLSQSSDPLSVSCTSSDLHPDESMLDMSTNVALRGGNGLPKIVASLPINCCCTTHGSTTVLLRELAAGCGRTGASCCCYTTHGEGTVREGFR